MSILHSWYETRSFFTRENLKKMVFLVWRGWVHLIKLWKDQPFYGVLLVALFVAGFLQGPMNRLGMILVSGFRALLIAMVRPSLFPAKINFFDWRFIATYGVCLYFAVWGSISGAWLLLLLPIGDYAFLVGFLLFDAQSGSDAAKSFVRAGRMCLYNLPILIVLSFVRDLLVVGGAVLVYPFALFLGKEIGSMVGGFLLFPFAVFIASCNMVFLSLLYSTWTVKDYSKYME